MSGAPRVIIVRKKAKGHGGGHGAAWKVAYADFVTAMMALFIVLWLLAQTDKELQKGLSEYFRTGVFSGAPSLLEGGSGLTEKGFVDSPRYDTPIESLEIEKNAENIRTRLMAALREDKRLGELEQFVTVTVNTRGISIDLTDGREELLFDVSSAALKPGLVAILRQLAPLLAQTEYRVEVHGHTDARPFPEGSTRNNWTLSFERAEEARAVLEQAGLPMKRLVGVFAHGDSAMIDKKNPESAQNRRLSILALSPQKKR